METQMQKYWIEEVAHFDKASKAYDKGFSLKIVDEDPKDPNASYGITSTYNPFEKAQVTIHIKRRLAIIQAELDKNEDSDTDPMDVLNRELDKQGLKTVKGLSRPWEMPFNYSFLIDKEKNEWSEPASAYKQFVEASDLVAGIQGVIAMQLRKRAKNSPETFKIIEFTAEEIEQRAKAAQSLINMNETAKETDPTKD